jgi:hypothetical protein
MCTNRWFTGYLALGFTMLTPGGAEPRIDPVTVRTASELRQAVQQARPGTEILLAPGEYPGGFQFANLRGEPGCPIVIAAADPTRPPSIVGGGTGIHLTDPAHVELRDIAIRGATANGINIDDAGSFDTPAHHIALRGLRITDVGSRGNQDGIKLSGVDDFRIEGCTIERWGTGGGSGIDMVGSHRGVILGNSFRHSDTTGSTGVQAKGGTTDISIVRNRFENAGGRAVNIGGSTGLAYFRPPLAEVGEHYEARHITVENNWFIGSACAVAFVGVDGATVRHNTIYRPKRWALRILQENRAPGFVPSRNGKFAENIIVFHTSEWSSGGTNIGPGTAPATFRFERNVWYCLDAPERSTPALPASETGGTYGRDPLFRDPSRGDYRPQAASPARHAGVQGIE